MNKETLKEWLASERHELLDGTKQAIRQYVAQLRAQHSDIYGFALLPGETYEIKDLVAAWNRTQDIKKDGSYYRYCVDEWIHWDHKALSAVTPLIAVLNQQFSGLHSKDADDFVMDEFEIAHIRAYRSTFTRALRELKSEGVFDFPNADPYLAIWFSDSGSDIIFASVKELNSQRIIDEFKSAFE
ncbi:MAG TPA: DUF4303 domain-containing protein [Verrucomicrobiae bacterium]|jgi:hypothetical protein|nr:DUF4303 domain-containing protein [Verrucomicrobiae bacterium]